MQDIVNVVTPESGTVAEPPESEFCVKLPSGDVSVQLSTPFVLQKIVVREPRRTAAGTAQISTCGGIVGPVLEATIGGACGAGRGVVVMLCVMTGVGWPN